MQKGFWQTRWRDGRTGFHRPEVNDALERFGPTIFGPEPQRILVPLCGMTVDLDWLLDRGHTVYGVEFVPEAVAQLAERMGPPRQVHQASAGFVKWEWERLTVLQGDVFQLSKLNLPDFNGVWDRAAVVALDPQMRSRYAEVLCASLAPGGVILMRSFAYDQNRMDGPPFSVDTTCVHALFGESCVDLLESNHGEPDAKFQSRGLDWQSVNTYAIRP